MSTILWFMWSWDEWNGIMESIYDHTR